MVDTSVNNTGLFAVKHEGREGEAEHYAKICTISSGPLGPVPVCASVAVPCLCLSRFAGPLCAAQASLCVTAVRRQVGAGKKGRVGWRNAEKT